ncbi:MAG TPA: carboxypeptidase-like regulatory domain-containing protein [Fimbriiglobus sp.]|nr:carboxypeptidase-like regulatory domain-containing protein [Fimbriiglobus sp.]
MTRLLMVCGFAVLLAVGCSNNYGGRKEITGTVKLKGQPIKDGALVMFEALDGQDTGGNVATSNGAFTIPRENGLKPGKYLVRVTAGDGKTPVNPTNPTDPDAPPGPGGPGGTNIISKELVPRDWNVGSKHEITVTSDGPNKFDFDIP